MVGVFLVCYIVKMSETVLQEINVDLLMHLVKVGTFTYTHLLGKRFSFKMENDLKIRANQ